MACGRMLILLAGGMVDRNLGNVLDLEAAADADAAAATVGSSVSSHGFHGGLQVGYQGFELVFSGYTGKGLGSTLQLESRRAGWSRRGARPLWVHRPGHLHLPGPHQIRLQLR